MNKRDHHLVQRVLDGTVSATEFNALQKRLRLEPSLAKLYGEYAVLHYTLHEEFEGAPRSGAVVIYPRSRSFRSIQWLAAAAAIALISWGVITQINSKSTAENPIVQASFSMDSSWKTDGLPSRANSLVMLKAGNTLQLDQGQATLSIGPSTRAFLEGPATLTIVSDQEIHLTKGRCRFMMGAQANKILVTSPLISVEHIGTEFGVQANENGADQLHVFDGKVRMQLISNQRVAELAAGEASQILSTGEVTRLPSDPTHFSHAATGFQSIMDGPLLKSNWRFPYGTATVSDSIFEGENFSAFMKLSLPQSGDHGYVLLATLETAQPTDGTFHTDGWAGISFFYQGAEILFFGDCFGIYKTWALDVKQRIPVIIPETPVVGPKTVTLCYQSRTGRVSLHQGGFPLGEPFCVGSLPIGTHFDEVRLGASSGAALAVRSLTIRTRED